MNEQYSAMRSNVSMLGKLLGDTIKDALGENILDQVETAPLPEGHVREEVHESLEDAASRSAPLLGEMDDTWGLDPVTALEGRTTDLHPAQDVQEADAEEAPAPHGVMDLLAVLPPYVRRNLP